jgi:ribose transport system ATP-binding protein
VDIGSRQQIFQTIRDASETGTSFVVSSAEYGDLATICHRVLVFRDGRVTKVLKGAEVTEGKIAQESLR